MSVVDLAYTFVFLGSLSILFLFFLALLHTWNENKKKEVNRGFKEGWQAQKRGVKRTENPYYRASDYAYRAWWEGWDARRKWEAGRVI